MLFRVLTGIFSLSIAVHASQPNYLKGLKFPENPVVEGEHALSTKALLPSLDSFQGGMNKLLAHVVSSPYQDDAGSCLFMAHTGAVEWWLSKLGLGQRLDLSERYYMNLSKAGIGDELMSDWQTDTIYRMNSAKVTYRNSDFPFLKAWYEYDGRGQRQFSTEDNPHAYYGTSANWILSLDTLRGAPIPLPHFERTVLFAEAEGNQWAVNVAPKDIVAQMKKWLDEKQSPLIVLYNHHAYWHAVMVVGYNDHASTDGCEFTVSFTDSMNENARESRELAAKTTDPDERRRLLSKARRDEARGLAVAQELANNGGCSPKGVFYVRDSLYPDKNLPLYDFDPSQEGEEEHLVTPVVLREYEWVERLGNHVMGISAQ